MLTKTGQKFFQKNLDRMLISDILQLNYVKYESSHYPQINGHS